MPIITGESDMVFGSLACACTLGRAGVRNRSGFVKTNAGSVRNRLSDGLEGPSAYQAARSGPLASTAFGLYRAGLA
jgi:hypothetical protein